MIGKSRYLFFAALIFLSASCLNKEETGKLALKFTFSVDTDMLKTYEMIYTNAAGNLYEVAEVKYFISDIYLKRSNGDMIGITDKNSIHYVDYDMVNTHTWTIRDLLPAGEYQSVSFTFGLSKQKNKSNYFVNPPESHMSWPEVLGGGYHYLQINGRWMEAGSPSPFNFHTGIGQIYEGESITGFVHNDFTVTVPASSFTIYDEKTTTLTLDMNINNWFTNPNIFDFDIRGGGIMQNQMAQEIIRQNGQDVFSVRDKGLLN